MLTFVRRAFDFARRRKTGAACGCFVAGTMVWTAAGQVPIQDVTVGDFVVAQDERSGLAIFGQVGTEIVTYDAALVELELRHQSGRTETLETTDEHPFAVFTDDVLPDAYTDSADLNNPISPTNLAHADTTWTRVDGLSPGNKVKTLAGYATITEVRFTDRRTTVYNFSVHNTPTYFVGDEGTLVHNCVVSSWARRKWHDQKQIKYHWDKWGKKLGYTIDEYTEAGLGFMNANRSKAIKHNLNRPNKIGLKYKDQSTGEFVIFTENGQLVTYGVDK